ncbi:MAG TPA: S41 family peptidase [Anaerolineae bacterium]|nr:S41 family peptidase [Anaerolineae bacterium]
MKIKLTRKHLTDFVFLLILSAVWFLIGWFVRGWSLGPEVVLVEQARQELLTAYPGEAPTSRDLTLAAIRGMLRLTADPYAALLEPEASARFQVDFDGDNGTIGLSPEVRDGKIVVANLLPGDPAERAGLRVGDVLLSVDEVEFDEATTYTEASLLVRGPIGAPAHIVAQRDGATLTFDPVRRKRVFATAEMLDGGVAYLKQHAFTTNVAPVVEAALRELLAQNPRGLIWDLRLNGGGSMEITREILSYFVKEGLLFSAELKDGQQRPFMAQGEALAGDIPLVVLIGPTTFSSAETAAAAIHERERGMLIGGTTYGKGTIQTTVPLIENHLLHYSIAKWLSPSGQWFGGHGVPPDISVTDDPNTEADEVLQFAVDYLQQLNPH